MAIRLIIYLSPLLLGLITPFLMNTKRVYEHTQKRSILKLLSIFIPAFIVTFGLILILSLSFLFSGVDFTKSLNLLLFLVGFNGLIISLFILLIRLGVSSNLSQLIIMVLVIMMCGTVFYANPFIETYRTDQEIRQTIINLAVNLNPILVIAGNFWGHDLLRAQQMYQISLIGPYYPYSYTDWRYLLIGYWVIAILCLAISQIVLPRKSSSESLPQG